MDSNHCLLNHNSIKVEVHTSHGKGIKLSTITHHLNKLKNKHLFKPFINKIGKTSTISNSSFFIPNDYLNSNDPDQRIEFNNINGLLDRTNEECIKEHYNLNIKTSIGFTHLIDESPVTDLDQSINDDVISIEKDE